LLENGWPFNAKASSQRVCASSFCNFSFASPDIAVSR
jgi:hypothetical protein